MAEDYLRKKREELAREYGTRAPYAQSNTMQQGLQRTVQRQEQLPSLPDQEMLKTKALKQSTDPLDVKRTFKRIPSLEDINYERSYKEVPSYAIDDGEYPTQIYERVPNPDYVPMTEEEYEEMVFEKNFPNRRAYDMYYEHMSRLPQLRKQLEDRRYAGLDEHPEVADPELQAMMSYLVDKGSFGDTRPEMAEVYLEELLAQRDAQKAESDLLEMLRNLPSEGGE